MPDFTVGVQLGLELTRAFEPQTVRKAGLTTYDFFVKLARDLRLFGSDLLVETDLADVLGRVQIEPSLERRFRDDVLKAIKIKPIHKGTILALSTGAGPTLTEASKNIQGLMAAVIQLSFLSWVYQRTTLASTLDECLNKRFEMGLPEAKPSPGFSGIIKVLEVCSSQTSDFDWFLYIQPVRIRLQAVGMVSTATDDDSIVLPITILRACLDCLYIVQRMPSERFMIVSEPGGLLTLIVWAYSLLGLTVLVIDISTSNRVGFPQDDCPNPSVIIEYTAKRPRKSTVSILDSSKEEVIKIEPERDDASPPMETRERLKLRGYGTIILCRHLRESLDVFLQEPDNSALIEGAQMTMAMARLISQRLMRSPGSKGDHPDKCSVDRKKVYDAARTFFGHPHNPDPTLRVRYEEATADDYLKMMTEAKSWRDVEVPTALRIWKRKDKDKDENDEDDKITSSTFVDLSITLLCIAAVVGIDDCTDIKLVLEDCFEERGDFGNRVSTMKNVIPFRSHDLLAHITRLLLGQELALAASADEDNPGDGNCFMVSDFGWTVCLPTFGDSDPSTVLPDSLFIRKSVPTNEKTLERKNRVHDALRPGIEITGNVNSKIEWIRDRGKATYDPRCISPVHDRVEYYGSRDNGFHLNHQIQRQTCRIQGSAGRAVLV